jgi:2-keto-3-deoxy-L-rhamnonate aldolase
MQCSHATYLAQSGIRGLVLLGSTGEAVHLSDHERIQLISGVRHALDDAGYKYFPLVAGTATQSVAQTVALLRDARDAGAQWGMVLAPGYFSTVISQIGIATWFEAVADQSVLPILV